MGAFSPLVFSMGGGAGRETETVIKSLAHHISEKHGELKSVVMSTIRTKISFELVRSALVCLRGSRDWNHKPEKKPYPFCPGPAEPEGYYDHSEVLDFNITYTNARLQTSNFQ